MSTFVAVAVGLYLAAIAVLAITLWLERELDGFGQAFDDGWASVTDADLMPLPSPDASDAEFERWAMQALGIANSAAFEASVRADIEALTKGDVA